MGPELQRRLEALFAEAVGTSGAERTDVVAAAYAEAEELGERLEALLAADERADDLLEPPTPGARLSAGHRLGDFTLLRQLGRGGMGVVWEARQESLNRRVALKLLAPHLSIRESATQRFLREAEAGARLEHPGLVRVYAKGELDGVHFIAQELVEGGRTLADEIRERREELETPPDYYRETAALFARIADALAVAHEVGVIHRDVKPGNVLLTADGRAKVADFGLAQVEDALALSRTGEFVGTPFYMSPEQAASRRGTIDHRTDVFSLGATLYEALTLSRPFDGDTSQEVIAKILLADPPDPRRLRARVPRDLAVICTRALEKNPERRYATMAAFADDLRRFLGDEPILAKPPTALDAVNKWCRRHPVATVGLVMASLAVIGTSFGVARAARAQARVLRLADAQDLKELVREADELWPAIPDRAEQYRSWLDRAGELLSRLPEHEATLASLEADAAHGEDGELVFESSEDRWWHAQLSDLIASLRGLSDPDSGLVDGIAPAHGPGVSRRLAFADSVRARTLEGPAAAAWEEAIRSIADRDLCPRYEGLAVRPQLGLLPLRRDPLSGLWEFTHVESGAPPSIDAETGELVVTPETGLVFVLLPGGTFVQGAQNEDEDGPNFDPLASPQEAPGEPVELAPFFVSKFEMTQEQWARVTGANPSYFESSHALVGATHPVEQVTWSECDVVLVHRLGLTLPTEAQWEYATRGGTESPWSSGWAESDVQDVGNVCDQSFELLIGLPEWVSEDWNDGYAVHAPVGRFAPNGFGLHDVHGNVWEWCRDVFASYAEDARPGDGERTPDSGEKRVFRGGSFFYGAGISRSAFRYYYPPEFARHNLGVRPARRLD